jgi:hypothetical protein
MKSVDTTWHGGWAHEARSRLSALKRSAPLVQVLSIVVFLRYLLLAIVGVFIDATFPLARPADFTVREQPSIWDIFARYDSGWYYDIARNGYFYLGDQSIPRVCSSSRRLRAFTGFARVAGSWGAWPGLWHRSHASTASFRW